MRVTTGACLLCFAGCAAIELGATGCSRGCEADYTCLPEHAVGADRCPDDPAEGPVAEGCGEWVSASLGDDNNPGTRVLPLQHLGVAIERAGKGSKRVYACGETYDEAIALPAGISLFGGFDCKNGWAYAADKRALLAPASATVALTLTEREGMSFVGDLDVRSPDAKMKGASSIAILTYPQATAELRRCDIEAGDGADGADGDAGQHNGLPAEDGLPGKNGRDACTEGLGLGGEQVALDCGDTVSTGGAGGDGNEVVANDGSQGLDPPDPNAKGYGAGGKGEKGLACTAGLGGAQGTHGENGLGAHGLGRLTKEGYIGVAGGDGSSGSPGQGGGGGGASLGRAACGMAPHGGAGGGSGGTGGCGGKGGKGGQPGGSSIGVAVLGNGVALRGVHITTGRGGNGGNGGPLQSGGQGGLPGVGGLGFNDLIGGVQSGCGGGVGGNGGNGGHGGGGHGGHSLPIARVQGAHALAPGIVDYVHGKPGQGGHGGNPLIKVGDGDPGEVTDGNILDP